MHNADGMNQIEKQNLTLTCPHFREKKMIEIENHFQVE